MLRRSSQSLAAAVAAAVAFGTAVRSAPAAEPVGAAGRASLSQKGSLLYFPHVEVKWDAAGNLRQDTFLELSNDFPENVHVQLYFVNGDSPLPPEYALDGVTLIERSHPGWNWVDNQIPMTGNEPTYWSMATGMPKGVSSFSILDPGAPVGRPDPDPDNVGGRTIRGFCVGWAVDAQGREIRWNHLSGSAAMVDYVETAAWEYQAWAFQSLGADHGGQPSSCLAYNLDNGQCVDKQVAPGRIDLDGYEYDACPNRLQFQFRAVGAPIAGYGPNSPPVQAENFLTLALCSTDLRQETAGPVTTKAKFDFWNENEVRFSGTERCITCWDLSPLGAYTPFGSPNHFLVTNLHTEKGRARVNGMASVVCEGNGAESADSALLGVMHKVLRFPPLGTLAIDQSVEVVRVEKAGVALGGQGEEVGQVLYDIVEPPQEARDGNGG